MKTTLGVGACVGAVCTAVGLGFGGSRLEAQQSGGSNGPAMTRVATIRIKPDSATAWLALQRDEAVPALKKAGVPWRWVFSNGGPIGPGFTYVIVQPVASFAQFDQGPALRRGMGNEAYAKYQDKERTMIVASEAIVQASVPAATLQGRSTAPPAHAIVTTVLLRPHKGPDWRDITAKEYLPALKKAGVTDYWVFATLLGGPAAQRTIVQPFATYADLDPGPPLRRALGADGARTLNLKRAELQAGASTTSVVTYIPEASFGMPDARR